MLRLPCEATRAVSEMLNHSFIDPHVAFVRAEVCRETWPQRRPLLIAVPCPVPGSGSRSLGLDRETPRKILVGKSEPEMSRFIGFAAKVIGTLSTRRQGITRRLNTSLDPL